MSIDLEKPSIFKNPRVRYLTYGIVAIILSTIHIVLMDFVAIGGLTPDLLLILCIWITLREGQFTGIFAGFACGLIFDIFTFDVIGTNALAKTLAAFLAGFFYREKMPEEVIHSMKFLIIILACSILHNFVYYFFYVKPGEVSFLPFYLKYGVALSLYTTVCAIFVILIKFPRKRFA